MGFPPAGVRRIRAGSEVTLASRCVGAAPAGSSGGHRLLCDVTPSSARRRRLRAAAGRGNGSATHQHHRRLAVRPPRDSAAAAAGGRPISHGPVRPPPVADRATRAPLERSAEPASRAGRQRRRSISWAARRRRDRTRAARPRRTGERRQPAVRERPPRWQTLAWSLGSSDIPSFAVCRTSRPSHDKYGQANRTC